MRTLPITLIVSLFVLSHTSSAQESIRLNQIGFYPDAPKMAVVVGTEAERFEIQHLESGETVFEGALGHERAWEPSGETVRLADFSDFDEPGEYRLVVRNGEASHPFSIRPAVHEDVARATVKAFYYQRASAELLAEHAGRWARAAGHPDDHVLIHPSAASDDRPAGTVVSAPRGWYDAGDYNKYIVNSGITTGTLLSLFEDFPDYTGHEALNIPESGNGVPDLLDEIKWNLDWMLAMQDPADGGVYTKLTTANFEGSVRPDQAVATRYVVQKSTPAALNLAAVAAQAARVYRPFDDAYPGFADRALDVALAAWEWARLNPDVMYRQFAMNQEFDPDITTGGYGDRSVDDEFAWAAAELFITTRTDSFLNAVDIIEADEMRLPSWNQVRALAYYSLTRHGESLPAAAASIVDRARSGLIALADQFVAGIEASAYAVAMGTGRDFIWGSNSVAANQGITLINAYRLTGEAAYLHGALANLDYILGRNATGFSFVTGYGSKSTMHPHHRPSESDDVDDPVPGLLAGGPNPGQQDNCTYPADEPARSYVDDDCSYASNEIAINWNAPMAYLSAAVDALFSAP